MAQAVNFDGIMTQPFGGGCLEARSYGGHPLTPLTPWPTFRGHDWQGVVAKPTPAHWSLQYHDWIIANRSHVCIRWCCGGRNCNSQGCECGTMRCWQRVNGEGDKTSRLSLRVMRRMPIGCLLITPLFTPCSYSIRLRSDGLPLHRELCRPTPMQIEYLLGDPLVIYQPAWQRQSTMTK
jgi:hypothetical protein